MKTKVPFKKLYTTAILMIILMGFRAHTVLSAPGNDNFASATDVTSLINASCTSGGAYTNVSGTSDQSKGSCWSGGPYSNVWFKFTATSSGFINIQVKVNGTGETMRYPMLALWTSTPSQLQCQNQQGYGNGTSNLSMSYYGLTAGTTYYFSVDNYTSWGTTGTFDICLSDVPDYDYPQGATDLTSSINAGCSTGGTYSNQYATSDNSKGSCWSGGPYNNRWFKFTATSTTFINVQVKVSGSGETMRYPMVALWDATLSTQLQCQNQQGYGNGSTDLSVSYYGLTPGNTYYIEVDNYTPWGSTGKFDICLSDVVDYDYPQGATDLTSSINATCSGSGVYSNQYATSDNSKGSCWSGGPYNNRWFKFTASSTTFINVQVKVSGSGETMRYPMVALWDATLSTQLQCQNQQGYGNGSTDLSVSYYGLTPGNTYYIEVDNYTPWGSTGKFDICLSDVVDYDYPQGATDLTSSINAGCSTGGNYSNQYATSDNSKGSCWSGGPYQNRWFKFTASSTTFINVQVMVSGSGETMRYPMVALWDASLSTQLQCQNQQGYGNGSTDLSVSYYGLTPGNTYYIEVDNYTPWGSTGKFDVCLSDIPDYDYPQGAVDLTAGNYVNAGCTSGGTYSNQYATSDHSKGSCWSGGPYNNRWFKFTATSTSFINVQVKVSGSGETMRYPMVALWDASLSTQVQCQNQQGYGNGSSDLSMSYYGLTPGNTYYIEVDNYTPWGSKGTFDLCVSDQPDYDYPQGATDLTSVMNGCSTGGTYSNQYATSDHSKGSCWSGGPYQNRWFKFTASSTTFINVQVMVSGSGETMRYPMVALWDASLSTELQCENQQGYGNGSTDLSMSYYGLTPGNTYYIEVDNYTPWGSTGAFDICVSDQPDYDYPQGAVTLTNVNNYCSTGSSYSNSTATSDHSKGSCWSGGPYKNRWFKFQAISSTVTATVSVSSGTMRYAMMALWASDYTTQLACTNQAGYGSGSSNRTLTYSSLTVGNWYYISVDNYTPWGSSGTFDICINNATSVQYYSIGTGDWSNTANWSTTGFAGSSAGTIPSTGNIVNIQDQTITVSSTQSCAQVNMTISSASTGLTVNNALLTVNGTYNQTNSGTNSDMTTTVQNSGTLTVNDNANFTRSGGNNDFQLNVTGGIMTVGQDMIWTSSGGTAKTNQMNVTGTGTVTITRDLTLSSSGGKLVNHTIDNNARLNVGRDITFTANAAGLTQVTLSGSSNLNLSRNFVRGTTPYGTLSMASTASLTLNGSGVGNTQNLVGIAGSGGDAFNYTNVVFNNTTGNNPSIFATGAITITGSLTLTRGVISTSSTNLLTLASGATCSSGNSNSYVSGPIAKAGNTAFVFPTGAGTTFARIGITAPATATNTMTAQYYHSGYANKPFNSPLTNVSGIEYWTLSQTASDAVQVTLYWQSATASNILTYDNTLRVAHFNGTSWDDVGQAAISGGSSGNVTSNSISSFSPFTFGSTTYSSNPLPIELLDFNAVPDGNKVDIQWATAQEINNAYFTIEKSADGQHFNKLIDVPGAGNSSIPLSYQESDYQPYDGISFYRLKQTDFNGASTTFNTVPVNFSVRKDVTVYPNPIDNTIPLNIQVNGYKNQSLQIRIIDMLGRDYCNKSITFTEDMQLHQLDNLTTASPGIYVVIITSNNETYTRKVIVR